MVSEENEKQKTSNLGRLGLHCVEEGIGLEEYVNIIMV